MELTYRELRQTTKPTSPKPQTPRENGFDPTAIPGRHTFALEGGHRVLVESTLAEYPLESATGTIFLELKTAFGSRWHTVSLAPDVTYFAID